MDSPKVSVFSHQLRDVIEGRARKGDGPATIAFALLELARAIETGSEPFSRLAAENRSIVKAVDDVKTALEAIGDCILVK